MSKKLVCVFSLAATLAIVLGNVAFGFGGGSDPSLAGWWKFDDGAGTVAKDSSGNGNDGTLSNPAPTWTTGTMGGALQFNGSTSVTAPHIALDNRSFTIALWINPVLTGSAVPFCQHQSSGSNISLHVRLGGPSSSDAPRRGVRLGFYNNDLSSPASILPEDNVWYHIACSYDYATGARNIFLNGVSKANDTSSSPLLPTTALETIGCYSSKGQYYTGLIDDVRVYQKALTAGEVAIVMAGSVDPVASDPKPPSKATDVPRDTVLSWTPGPYAKTHNVYFGTNFDDVNTASVATPKGVLAAQQDANSYDAPGVLQYGQTYYWRVDEVNAPPTDSTLFKGETWSFTVEPVAYAITAANIAATASSSYNVDSGPQKTIDGSGVSTSNQHDTTGANMWLSANGQQPPVWIQYQFDKVYKLYQMWVWNSNQTLESLIGLGVKTATIEYSTDGTTWTALPNVPEFAQAPGEASYEHNTTIDFGGASAQFVKITVTSGWGFVPQYGLSEVRFFYTPVWSREPYPASGATGVSPETSLSWRAGREAASHQVYLGTDPNALTLSGTAATTSYTPAGLNLGTQYYWRIDEVNTAEGVSMWAGSVWSFATSDYVAVDEMESYNDTTNCIYNVWADGYGTGTNGALVGYDTSANSTFCDTATVHGGKQSMPFRYGQNSAGTSEVTRTFTPAQDWNTFGIKALTLYFYGDPANAAVQLYVKINGTKITYTGSGENLQRRRWNPWNIDLLALTASAQKGVTTLTIGISGTGAGKLLIDDIRLYREAAALPVAANPGTTGLIAYYSFNNNVLDGSGHGNDGTPVGTPVYAAGLSAFGTALQFNGATDSVDLGKKAAFNPTGSFSVSLWANSTAWGTQWGHVMAANRGEDSMGWQIRRYNTTNSLCFTTRGAGNDDMQSVAAMPQNEWVHIACVYDSVGNTKRIYINGIQDSVLTTTAGARIAATTHNTCIGARATSANTGQEAWFSGMLDEVRLFDRALTAGEAEFLSDPTP